MLAVSLPFVWAELALTAGRLRAMGRSVAWALLFFVPVLKFVFALLLIALPEAHWRLWSDVILHRIHSRVLGHIRNLAEAEIRRP